jgi:hypothetical protein
MRKRIGGKRWGCTIAAYRDPPGREFGAACPRGGRSATPPTCRTESGPQAACHTVYDAANSCVPVANAFAPGSGARPLAMVTSSSDSDSSGAGAISHRGASLDRGFPGPTIEPVRRGLAYQLTRQLQTLSQEGCARASPESPGRTPSGGWHLRKREAGRYLLFSLSQDNYQRHRLQAGDSHFLEIFSFLTYPAEPELWDLPSRRRSAGWSENSDCREREGSSRLGGTPALNHGSHGSHG